MTEDPRMSEGRAKAAQVDPARYVLVALLVVLAFVVAYTYSWNAASTQAPAGQPAAIAASNTGEAACACGGGSDEVAEGATIPGEGVQTVYVDASDGYAPNRILASAGTPIELTFSEAFGCMEEVVFPEFRIARDLTQGGAVVELPSLEPGEYSFSCGMAMNFGTIVVE
jgi:hypothetical protein